MTLILATKMTARNFAPFPVLKTQRLTLRQLVSSDENEIFALRSNDNVNKYLGRQPSKSIDDARNFIRNINENIQRNESVYWAITLNGTDKLIGTICLFDFSDENQKAEIGFELLPDFQGKGIMQEATVKVIDYALQHIGVNSIEAYSHSENKSSARLLEKSNFRMYANVENSLILFKLTAKDQLEKNHK
jgi:ribosomal-protein-alanine N-acetyltransferase